MKRCFPRRRRLFSFTLIELLVVIAIIALLAGLGFPAYETMIAKAQGLRCGTNLHSIGIAATQAATDNNNQYPEIDQAGAPIYNPPGPDLVTALGPYGIVTNTIQCPADMALGSSSSFTKYKSSYEWDPVFDDESVTAPVIYIAPTIIVPVNSNRVRLALDFNPIHHGRPNVLFGDGHIVTH